MAATAVEASKYASAVKPSDEEVVEVDSDNSEYSIPTVDISLLTSPDLHQRSKMLSLLRNACQHWGFFVVINHGVSESLMNKMVESFEDFFNMTEEDKNEFQDARDVMQPICYGTNINCNIEGKKLLFWRNFLRFIAHPQFHSPYKPSGFREVAEEYSRKTRELATVLMRAISETLGLEPNCLKKATNLDEGFQFLTSNQYPPCPDPEKVIGLPPHTDLALMNILMQNDVGGLQILHKGKWVNWKAMPNTMIVDIGDQIQILSNGLYKSVNHRAVVNNKSTRISIVSVHGPGMNTKIDPIPELLEAHGQTPTYSGVSYKEYMQLAQRSQALLKPCIDLLLKTK